jgi:hypothetical protein
MSTIKLRRSGIAGKIPTTAQLDLGEVALNTYDGRLYIKKSVNSVESIVGIYGMPTSEETITVDSFAGDGSTTDFTLTRIPKADQYAYVSINGVRQHISEYSLNANVLTFSVAPELHDVIEIRVHDVTPNHVVVRDYQRYVYTANSDTSFTGSDDTGLTLEYDVGFVEVYVNGSRLVDGSDFTATDGTSITILEAVTGTAEIVSLSRASFADSQGGIPLTPTSASFTTTNADQVADTFNKVAYRTAKYLVQMSDGTDFHTTEVLLIHDGTSAYITEYGTIFTNASMGTIDADISGNDVRLLVTPANINTTVKTQRITVTV